MFSGCLFIKHRPVEDSENLENEDPDYVEDPERDNNEGKS